MQTKYQPMRFGWYFCIPDHPAASGFYEPAGKTFAEISPALKNQVSHRRNALMLMLGALNEKTDGRE